MTSPLDTQIGQSSRRWKRSIGPRRPSRDSPAASSSLNSKPLRSRCFVSVSQPDGAKPQPKCAAVSAQVAVEQVLARRRRLVRLQRLGVELLGGGIGGEQPAAAAPIALHAGRGPV